jgi:UDP-3-O-[3-hydroxymyristoyl] glucosamine N-acyltransferase
VTKQGGWRLDEIVARLGGELEGDGSVVVSQVATLVSAQNGQIAFLANPKYRQQLQSTNASAVIVPPKFAGDTSLPRIIHPTRMLTTPGSSGF